MKYLLLKHYRGGPAPAVDWAPMDQWTPAEVDAHVRFMRDLLVLGIVHHKLGVSVDDPAIVRPRDAYLEVFGDLAPRSELVAELGLACWVAKIARVLTWVRSVRQLDYDEEGEFVSAPLETLTGLLAPTWADLRLDS